MVRGNKYWVVRIVDMYNIELKNGFGDLISARKRLMDIRRNYKGNYEIIKFYD